MLFSHISTKLFHRRSIRLVAQFVLIALILFAFFMLLTFNFFKQNSRKNLDNYFSQNYFHTLEILERIIEENQSNLNAIAELPLIQEKLTMDLDVFMTPGGIAPAPSSINEVTPPPMLQDLTGRGSGTGTPGKIKHISPEGFILSEGPENRIKDKFKYFKVLVKKSGENNFGYFVITEASETGKFPQPVTTLYFFIKITPEDGPSPGYLLSEFPFSLVIGLPPEDDQRFSQTSLPGHLDNSIFHLDDDINKYLITSEGLPASSLVQGEKYSQELKDKGVEKEYTVIPLTDPALLADNSQLSVSNIPLVETLLDNRKSGLIRMKKPFWNYQHKKVEGGGFWIDNLGLGMIMEIEKGIAFQHYWPSIFLTFSILLLCFIFYLYLILWINRLRKEALDANPLTQLPGNRTINKTLTSMIEKKKQVAVIYGDLDNFKAFNDTYGFSMGDQVIQFTAEILKSSLYKYNDKDNFCGHIGGDDFIFIVPEENMEKVTDEIGSSFDEGIREFYSKEHLEQGYIEERNREGKLFKFPIMSFSMAGVLTKKVPLTHYLDIANRCGELKKISKQTPGSTLVLERRQNGNETSKNE